MYFLCIIIFFLIACFVNSSPEFTFQMALVLAVKMLKHKLKCTQKVFLCFCLDVADVCRCVSLPLYFFGALPGLDCEHIFMRIYVFLFICGGRGILFAFLY
jgi:hypothetical protein